MSNAPRLHRRAGLSPADFCSFFSFPFTHKIFVAYLFLLCPHQHINTPCMASLKSRQPRPIFPFLSCVRFVLLHCLISSETTTLAVGQRPHALPHTLHLLTVKADIPRSFRDPAYPFGGRATNTRLSATPVCSIARPRSGRDAGSISFPFPSSNSRRGIAVCHTGPNSSTRRLRPLDVGTIPGPSSIYHLWKAFDFNSNVGGACGEIVALKGKYKEKLPSFLTSCLATQCLCRTSTTRCLTSLTSICISCRTRCLPACPSDASSVENQCLVTSLCSQELSARISILCYRMISVARGPHRNISLVKQWYVHAFVGGASH